MEIVELTTAAEFRAAFPVMRQFRPELRELDFMERLAFLRPRGYRLWAAREDERILGLLGVEVLTNLHDWRHLRVQEMVVAEDCRSQGVGAQLMGLAEDLARREGCGLIALSSGVRRKGAHRFYTRLGYEARAYKFMKRLPPDPGDSAPDVSQDGAGK